MIWNAFAIAVREIGRNLTRAFLTVLGIFIGVAAIITMVTLGQGATLAVKAQISSLGNNLLTLRPGAGFGSRASSAGTPHFTEKDATIIGEQIAGIAAVAPVRTASLKTPALQPSPGRRQFIFKSTSGIWPMVVFLPMPISARDRRCA